jgi:hypothetical protein
MESRFQRLSLIAKDLTEQIQEGYLAALKNVNFYQNFDIHNIASPLTVTFF